MNHMVNICSEIFTKRKDKYVILGQLPSLRNGNPFVQINKIASALETEHVESKQSVSCRLQQATDRQENVITFLNSIRFRN